MSKDYKLASFLNSINNFLRVPNLKLKRAKDGTVRYGNYIQTYTGQFFYPLDPRESEICIEDIAHSLANKCRFTGHTKQFYSVAQHSVLASNIVPPEFALEALLHDGSEAYLADMAKPVKVLDEMKNFRDIEDEIQRTICKKYGLPLVQSEVVHVADRVMLVTEKRDLMKNVAWTQFNYKEKPLAEEIFGWRPDEAKLKFLARFKELTATTNEESRTNK